MSEKKVPVLKKILTAKVTVIIFILALCYTLCGFLLLPFLIEKFLPEKLGSLLDREVSLENVAINPYSLSIEALGFRIKETTGEEIIGVNRLFVDLQFSSLFRWAFTFAEITVDTLSVNIIIDADGTVNLARLGTQTDKPAPDSTASVKKETGPVRLLLQSVGLNGCSVTLTDKRQTVPATTAFKPLNIKLNDISTLPDRKGPYTITAEGTDGTAIRWTGDVSLQPLRSEGSISVTGIPLTSLWQFARSSLNIEPPEGHLTVATRYRVDLSDTVPVARANDIAVHLDDLALSLSGAAQPMITVPEIALNVKEIDPISKKVDSLALLVRGDKVHLTVDETGKLNANGILARSAEPDSAVMPAPRTTEDTSDASWSVDIASMKLRDLACTFTDLSRERPVTCSVGRLEAGCNAAVTAGGPRTDAVVSDFTMRIDSIAAGFTDTSVPALFIGALSALEGTFDLGKNRASLGRLNISGGLIDVIRNNDNTINLTQVFVPETKPDAPAPDKKTPADTLSGDTSPLSFMLDTITLSGFTTVLTDRSVRPGKPLFLIDNMELNASGFDGASPFPFSAAMDFSQGGKLQANGVLNPSDVSLKTRVSVRDLGLPVAQPYLAGIAQDLTLASGRLSAGGSLTRSSRGSLSYRGGFAVNDLFITENSTKDTLAGWNEFSTKSLLFKLGPDSIGIDYLRLNGLTGKFIISEDNTINVVEAFADKRDTSDTLQSGKTDEEAAPEYAGEEKETGGKTMFPVSIARLGFENGSIFFADLSLRPQFGTRIHELGGVITGIASHPDSRTRIELGGRVDEYGTSSIAGAIDIFNPKQFTDMAVSFKNVAMDNLTPYSGKFAGYAIDSGKLSLDLQYKISDGKLDGQNSLIIDRLALGEKVESPDAVKLPLKLAIALLKDADGIIDLGLPVSGDLDDPEFRYGPLVWKTFTNLLKKVVTSPFKALDNLVGGKEKLLNVVQFEPGKRTISPPEREKLDKLADALLKRPQLRLVVSGNADAETDGDAIRKLTARREIAAANGLQFEPGTDPGPVDFNSKQVRRIIMELYIGRHGKNACDSIASRPLNKDAGTGKKSSTRKKPQHLSDNPTLLAEILFKEIVSGTAVPQQQLDRLAAERAKAVVSGITGPDGLRPERVTVAPSSAPEKGAAAVRLQLDTM